MLKKLIGEIKDKMIFMWYKLYIEIQNVMCIPLRVEKI